MCDTPKGWKVDWIDQGVGVFHPQDPMIWCVFQSQQFQGSSRELAEAVVAGAASHVGEVKPLIQKQVSQRPDLYGIKFSGQNKGIPFTAMVLTVTEDGQNFVIRQYSCPTKVYDEMKLTLIPILCSLRSQAGTGGTGDTKSGGWQYIQAPSGAWRVTAPGDWKSLRGPLPEDMMALVGGPKSQTGAIELGGGWNDYLALIRHNVIPTPINSNIPFIPAHELLQRITIPALQVTRRYPNLKIEKMHPIDTQTARYALSYTEPMARRSVWKGS